jgi:hypothetical protein
MMTTGQSEEEGLAARPEQARKEAKINQLVRLNATNKIEEEGRVVSQERATSQEESTPLVRDMNIPWTFHTLNTRVEDDHRVDRNTVKVLLCAALIVLPKPMA